MNPLKYWTSDEFEISSYKYSLDLRINNRYQTSGSDNTGNCQYTYNELGFRGDSPTKNGFKIMSIGCSLAEGIGVNDKETWPSRFSKLIPNGVDLNFGVSGRSNDYISRCLLSYYDYVKPDLVLIMYTFLNRREIYTDSNQIEPFMVGSSWGYLKEETDGLIIQNNLTEIQNRNEDIINWHKNHLIITQFLKLNNCNYIWNGGLDVPTEYTDAYRFDGDFINFLDLGVDGGHPGPKHNQTFATKLLNHINDNFPHFIFKKNNDNMIKKLI
jgi:lysophospholipase L1-like esterase